MSTDAAGGRPPLRKAGDADLNPVTPEPRREAPPVRLGGSTGDAVGAPDKDKLVDLGVKVPKSLRKSIRREAERLGIPVDKYVAEILRRR